MTSLSVSHRGILNTTQRFSQPTSSLATSLSPPSASLWPWHLPAVCLQLLHCMHGLISNYLYCIFYLFNIFMCFLGNFYFPRGNILLLLFKSILSINELIHSSVRDPNLRLDCADLRVTQRTSGLAPSHELVGGPELLASDPVTDRAPITHCRFKEHI